jgi:hypothetical protein
MEYPYQSSFILDDKTFVSYGGSTGSSTSFQRQAAYLIAERQMTSHIGAFLKPTIITGSHYWEGNNDPLALDMGYLRSIKGVSIVGGDGLLYLYSASDLTKYVFVRNVKNSYIDLLCTPYGWGCHPVNIEVSYESGLYTGTSMQPDVLWALTMAAQIFLNEVDVYLSNEGVADIGVQEFSNQFYHEIRTKLGHNEFGNSAIANKIASMVKHLRSHSALRFH